MWWQAEHDLSEKLLVYRATDSLVEFKIPLNDRPEAKAIARTTSDGFRYKGHFYEIVSLNVRGDTLHIAGLEMKSRAVWPSDLLAFINDHLTGSDDAHQKANHLLKFLLKEYSPTQQTSFCFCGPAWRKVIRIPNRPCSWMTRALLVYSPPPETQSHSNSSHWALLWCIIQAQRCNSGE